MWCRVPRLRSGKHVICLLPRSSTGGALASTALLHFEARARPRPRHVGLERARLRGRVKKWGRGKKGRRSLAEAAAEAKTAVTNERCVGEGGEA